MTVLGKVLPCKSPVGDSSTDPSPGAPSQEMLLCPAHRTQRAQIHHTLLGCAGTHGPGGATDSPYPAQCMVVVTLIVHVRPIWGQEIDLVTKNLLLASSLCQRHLEV